jgi:hypothetical protein
MRLRVRGCVKAGGAGRVLCCQWLFRRTGYLRKGSEQGKCGGSHLLDHLRVGPHDCAQRTAEVVHGWHEMGCVQGQHMYSV